MLRPLLLLAASTIALGLLGGCSGVGNGGDVVGGPCVVRTQCSQPDSFCQTGQRYPEGTCSMGCLVDDDCPGASTCADDDQFGDICLLECTSDDDCRDGYQCTELDVGGMDRAGTVMVCSNPI